MAGPPKPLPETSRKKRGRPPKTIDLQRVYDLRSIGCTDEEMASLLDVSERWIRSQKTKNAAFFAAYQKGWSDLHQSLRRMVVSRAKKSDTMLIWATKNILGWSDRQEMIGPRGGAIQLELTESAKRLRDQLIAPEPDAAPEVPKPS